MFEKSSEHLWSSLIIIKIGSWKSFENCCLYFEVVIEIFVYLRKSSGNLWKSSKIFGNLWKPLVNFRKLKNLTHYYTCQLSRLRHESHTCRLKTSIPRRLTPAGQFLTPD